MTQEKSETAFRLYPYKKVAAQDAPAQRHPVIIVGAGPVGLALALDLGQRGTPVLVLDDQEGAGLGSRAICFAKRTLDIAHRLGAGPAMLDKGVVWNVGKVFYGDKRVFEFNLQPEPGHRYPAFINLQQPWFEKFLFDALTAAQAGGAPVEIRGGSRVRSVRSAPDHAVLEIETPDGTYCAEADWLIACDGARSPVRKMLDLRFDGRVFEDNFLIADVKMKADFPTERWFWFEPPFKHSGQSALLHKQPDDIWRIDFQLGQNVDRTAELDPARVRARVDAMLGGGVEYDLEWTSVYTFQCRRMQNFRKDRVLFAGDSAHQVSPFGARGANSGVQDADNLGWKLDLVIRGLAPEKLVESYCGERIAAADENILNSTRSTDFLTPRTKVSQTFRNAVLTLAGHFEFARPLVNSGRLSVPFVYAGALTGSDALGGPDRTRPGAAASDAPLTQGFLLDRCTGVFTVLAINTALSLPEQIEGVRVDVLCLDTDRDDPGGAIRERYLGQADTAVYLLRPDQHIAARWQQATVTDITAALLRTIGKEV